MMNTCESIEKLENLVRNKKMQFMLKIYYLLSYTKTHDDDINKVGIFWVDDEGTMSVNSSILGIFVGLKANSINKNLMSYGIIKVRAPEGNKLDLNKLSGKIKWIYRKCTKYQFNSNTSYDEVIKFKPKFGMIEKINIPSKITSHKNELNNKLKISSISLLNNRNTIWENEFKSSFEKHWRDIADSSNAVYIKDIIKYLKDNQKEIFALKPRIESKILLILQFFSNNNIELIDIDDYFVFCVFFGIGGTMIYNIEKLPFEHEVELDIQEYLNTTGIEKTNNWFELNKYDQTLLKLMMNQRDDVWTLCFSNEPGIYILINKSGNCLFQTKVCFDALDNSYSIGTSNEGIKKFLSLNDLISFLNLKFSNHLNTELHLNSINVPADFLHFNLQEIYDFDETPPDDITTLIRNDTYEKQNFDQIFF
ncbi:hypothetical protein M9Y10_044818 [Tritrichomonas musculus]|uniref:Initiator binding domain-containing protein n=1 Tax=Tritrichomonas musculus TaxID=1915356 RepID=A0ABR2JU68_9EUKA